MISVCIASYNGVHFIEEQLLSILPQLEKDDEVVVSDDGSTDGTLDVVNALADPRIRVVRHKGRRGVVSNFENAINNARGEYIFLADQDDVWVEKKVGICMKHLENADLVLHNFCYHDDERADFFAIRGSKKGIIHNILCNSYTGCCMAFHRRVLDWALPFPENIPMHDSWIGLIAEVKGKVVFERKCLVRYRRHVGNVSFNSTNRSSLSVSTQIHHRFALALALVQRIIKLS